MDLLKELQVVKQKAQELETQLSGAAVLSNPKKMREVNEAYAALREIREIGERYEKILEEKMGAELALKETTDAAMRDFLESEITELEAKLPKLEQELLGALVPPDPLDKKNIVMEVRAGTGGDEAGLFAAELIRMYMRYAERNGWKVNLVSDSRNDQGGFKEAILLISGKNVYSQLKYESGVHRVQRVPETEKAGRVHTSTVTVAVLPEAKDVDPLMKNLVGWLNQEKDTHPVIKAGVAHYQFVTIHPFMDGNGRTARALATYILYHANYDLKQFISLEEFYSADRSKYYQELQNCQGHNYYNRPNADITSWLEYFICGVAVVFEEVKNKAVEANEKSRSEVPKQNIDLLENIGQRERNLLKFFKKEAQLRTKDVSKLFRIKDRSARDLIKRWLDMELLERKGTGDKNAYYVLTPQYRKLIDLQE